MITKLKLRNWKSHLNSEFEFSKGVNGLIGIMGSGKTSVVQGISFALFGTFPGLQARRLVLDDLIMKKPSKKNFAQVELEFVLDGSKYNILRNIEAGRGTTKAEIRKNGKMIEVNPQGVTRIVEDILQMDYDLFSKAVYSEQNSIDYFLRIPRGHRMEHIDRMLKVDEFERVREQVVSLGNRLKAGIDEKLKFIVELEKENIDAKIKSIETELAELKARSGKLEMHAAKVRKESEHLSSLLLKYENIEKELSSMKIEIEGLNSGVSELEKNLQKIRAKLGEEKPESAKRNMKILERKLEQAELALERETRNTEKIREEIASINAEIRITAQSLEEMEKLRDKCPVCETRITETKKKEIISEKVKRQKELESKLKVFVLKLENAKKFRDSAEAELREREREREKLAVVLEEMENMEELEERKGRYMKRKGELENRVGLLECELKKYDVKSARKELQRIKMEEGRVSTMLENIREKIKDREARLEELEERKAMLESYRRETERDEKLVAMLISFENVLKITQDQLRDEFLKTVNKIMNAVWNGLYPYGDFPEIRLFIEGDYILQLRTSDGSWVSAEGVISGGERSMACLALRIAFSLAFIPNLKWLILDEPTHNLDANAIEQFAMVLREKIHKFTEQVFLITHEDRLVEGMAGKLYRLERDKEGDGATKVSHG